MYYSILSPEFNFSLFLYLKISVLQGVSDNLLILGTKSAFLNFKNDKEAINGN